MFKIKKKTPKIIYSYAVNISEKIYLIHPPNKSATYKNDELFILKFSSIVTYCHNYFKHRNCFYVIHYDMSF